MANLILLKLHLVFDSEASASAWKDTVEISSKKTGSHEWQLDLGAEKWLLDSDGLHLSSNVVTADGDVKWCFEAQDMFDVVDKASGLVQAEARYCSFEDDQRGYLMWNSLTDIVMDAYADPRQWPQPPDAVLDDDDAYDKFCEEREEEVERIILEDPTIDKYTREMARDQRDRRNRTVAEVAETIRCSLNQKEKTMT